MTDNAKHLADARLRAVASCLAAVAIAANLALAGCSSQPAASDSGDASNAGAPAAASTGSAASASAASAQDGAVAFTDDLGREVVVQSRPQRVVVGMGSLGDMWQLAGGELVGAPDEAFADYGLDAAKVSSIGGFAQVSQEAILDLDPDFVILTGNSSGRAGTASQTDLEQGLADAGIPVAYFKVTVFDDYLRTLKTMCAITGRDDLYQENGADVQADVQEAIDEYKPAAEGKTFLLGITYSQGVRAQTSESQTGAMLADLGAVNIVDANKGLLSDFSVEALLEVDPDYIFLIPMGDDEAAAQASLDALTSDAAWSSLSAVKDGHVVTLPRSLYLDKPDAKWAEAYEGLGKDLS